MKLIITPNILRNYINIKGVRISYDSDTKVVRIIHKNYETICDINQWLLDSFPHYWQNITYGLPEGKATCSWLDIICIDNNYNKIN